MTEKEYNQKQRENKVLAKQKNVNKKEIVETKIKEEKNEEKLKTDSLKEKLDKNKIEEEKKVKEEKKQKKEYAIINGKSLPLSTKDSAAVCKFIKFKLIDKAIEDLEDVLKFKKVIPMKKGFPHKKGKRVMAGRYHTKTTKYFIKLLKELKANSNVNGIENPFIIEAIANKASMPYGRFGRVRKKRTHIKIKAINKSELKKN